jgi:hypothetical protein
MMEYKVCFHMSYTPNWEVAGESPKKKKFHGKMHYCGHTLEEAVAKIRKFVARYQVHERGTCTSMWIMRGRRKGDNIKWNDYHSKGEPKKEWKRVLETATKEMNRKRLNLFPLGSL